MHNLFPAESLKVAENPKKKLQLKLPFGMAMPEPTLAQSFPESRDDARRRTIKKESSHTRPQLGIGISEPNMAHSFPESMIPYSMTHESPYGPWSPPALPMSAPSSAPLPLNALYSKTTLSAPFTGQVGDPDYKPLPATWNQSFAHPTNQDEQSESSALNGFMEATDGANEFDAAKVNTFVPLAVGINHRSAEHPLAGAFGGVDPRFISPLLNQSGCQHPNFSRTDMEEDEEEDVPWLQSEVESVDEFRNQDGVVFFGVNPVGDGDVVDKLEDSSPGATNVRLKSGFSN
ncbi:hypothetical protein BDK51DRAFT_43376 [Blyttiomyces helicus]|uniref:Uncharacterized protein n=1 Tax=Blyttiomyces helicus TaxID=388810 RepID=A0A4P9WM98_9FUNG|nr:hypothetical protein BDK51DRAFT_43376 [Blyttiomyces helicus]|eukprot:RKO93582.1 hypothetical protein BDK51DRAFT_43376 [Blyttiomyces helicus]